VARGLETEWEKRLRDLATAEAELERRQQQRPRDSVPKKKADSGFWAPICARSGPLPPPRIETAKSSCVRFWKR
jgi:hypothetical protein